MNGKGSKSRITNHRLFNNNFECIEWRPKGSYCLNCGSSIHPETIKRRPDLFIKNADGSIEHKNECNFN